MLGLEKELEIFVHAVIAGMAVYGTYTLLRVIRRIVKHNLLSISIEDFLFWVGTSFYLFIEIYYTSDGSVRWFFILGVVLGKENQRFYFEILRISFFIRLFFCRNTQCLMNR